MSFCRKYHHINRCEIQFSKLIWIIDLLTTTTKKKIILSSNLKTATAFNWFIRLQNHLHFAQGILFWKKNIQFLIWSCQFFTTQIFYTRIILPTLLLILCNLFFNLQNPIPKCLVVQTCTLIRVPPLIWLVFQNSIQNHQVMLRGILMIRYILK